MIGHARTRSQVRQHNLSLCVFFVDPRSTPLCPQTLWAKNYSIEINGLKWNLFFNFSSEESVAKQLQCRQKALLQPASDELSVRSIWGKYNSQVFQVNLFFIFFNFFRASFVLKRNPRWPWSWLSPSCGRWGVRQQLQPQPQWQNQKMRQRMNMGRGGQWTELSGIMEKMTCRLVRWDVAGCAASCWIGEPIL